MKPDNKSARQAPGAGTYATGPSAAPVADTYHTKKTEKIVRGEEFEPVGTMPVVGDRVRLNGKLWTLTKHLPLSDPWDILPEDTNICCRMAGGTVVAGIARILKRERGTELLGARVFMCRAAWGQVNVCYMGKRWYKHMGDGPVKDKWALATGMSSPRDCEANGDRELSPDEAKPYLADPALLALVGG